MVKKGFSIIIIVLFVFSLFSSFCQPVFAKNVSKIKKFYKLKKTIKTKKTIKKTKRPTRRRFYVYKKRSLKLYQEMLLSPIIGKDDFKSIKKALIKNGASSVKLNAQKNTLILQYRSADLNVVTIIKLVNEVGYSVLSID